MPSNFLRLLLCCSREPPSAHDEPFLHANRPITVATPAVPSPPSSTRRPPPPTTTAPHQHTTPPPATPTSSPPASIRPSAAVPLLLRSRRHPSSHYPSSCYSRETASPEPPPATKYPSWFTKSDTVRKMALGPWHPDNLRVEFAAGCSGGAAAPGKSIYRLPKRG